MSNEIPYSLASDNETEFYDNLLRTFKDMFNNLGGAGVGDVFTAEKDVFTLNVNTKNTGLSKNTDNELDFKLSADSISNTPAGGIETTNVQAALNELDGDKISLDGSGNCYLGSLQVLQVATGTRVADNATIIVPKMQEGDSFLWANTLDYVSIELPSGDHKEWYK